MSAIDKDEEASLKEMREFFGDTDIRNIQAFDKEFRAYYKGVRNHVKIKLDEIKKSNFNSDIIDFHVKNMVVFIAQGGTLQQLNQSYYMEYLRKMGTAFVFRRYGEIFGRFFGVIDYWLALDNDLIWNLMELNSQPHEYIMIFREFKRAMQEHMKFYGNRKLSTKYISIQISRSASRVKNPKRKSFLLEAAKVFQ